MEKIQAKLCTNDGTFSLDVLGYEFPDSTDDWDQDWLIVSLIWKGAHATFTLEGPYLLRSELETLIEKFESGSDFEFEGLEPMIQLYVKKIDTLGQFSIEIHLRGESTEYLEVEVEIDQSDLRCFASDLRSILP